MRTRLGIHPAALERMASTHTGEIRYDFILRTGNAFFGGKAASGASDQHVSAIGRIPMETVTGQERS